MAFVFIDESEYTIDDGYFAVLVNEPTWQNFPAYRHGGSGTLSFADGHSEVKRWTEASTGTLKNPAGFVPAPKSGNERNRDLQWLSDRTFTPKAVDNRCTASSSVKAKNQSFFGTRTLMGRRLAFQRYCGCSRTKNINH
jgi:prepilin-type processing-associated H-X9-DG protein